MQGWMDLAQLVSSAGGVKGAYEKLANKIGRPLGGIVVSAGCSGSDIDCLQQPLVCASQRASRGRCTATCLLVAG